MITQKQHLEICQKIHDLRSVGVPVYTYDRVKIIGVDVENGEIRLANQTKITWRSYLPDTKLRKAWEKFQIEPINLYQIKRSRMVHSQYCEIAKAR